MIFNSDPKIQAEQMINAFVWDEHLIEYTDNISGTTEYRNMYRREGIKCALIAAKACKECVSFPSGLDPEFGYKTGTYWNHVITELEKYEREA